MTIRPAARPKNARFSSGPCAKRPGWTPQALEDAALGRSHRAKPAKPSSSSRSISLARFSAFPPITASASPRARTPAPSRWRCGRCWAPVRVDVLAWESFGEGWVSDIVKELKLADVRALKAPYGELPDLGEVDCDHDVVFTWNGTTSGVRVPDGDWIAADRKGLTICDATSAAFAQALDWAKLDVVTFSWQKALGGEAGHGMIVLSPRAVERLETYKPAWPMPKLFRMTKGGKLVEGIFEGETINTPSLLCVEDYIDALNWAQEPRRPDAP